MAYKILIAEDEPDVLTMYERFFRLENFDVQTAVDGLEAMQKARSYMPDLIALDIMMPGKDGIQVLREIKADPALKHIHVAMLTNLGEETFEEECFRLGAEAYMLKIDFSPDKVVSRINQILEPMSPAQI